jgi:glycopeptide antibiotics resistance protein
MTKSNKYFTTDNIAATTFIIYICGLVAAFLFY